MELKDLIQNHLACFDLCYRAFGMYFPVAGNIGIFCQSEEEFEDFTKMCTELTYSSDNLNQKYFELKIPIAINSIGAFPPAVYTHLYIRRPNIASPEVGDIDFVLSLDDYKKLKDRILKGEKIAGASIYDRPGWDTIEIRNPEINALAYISTQEMAEKVRVKF
ncbi:MAG: hypothetical protein JWM68_5187 [Verrucomicrobiales bacterium]|nr:hypothetical protein [Verrucomicrobiales bacterium]